LKEANKIGLWLIDLNLDEGYGILRCSHYTKEILITALSLVRKIDGINVILSPLKTSGTIKTLKNEINKTRDS
jgi:RNase P/RNase MRP subunit POP5